MTKKKELELELELLIKLVESNKKHERHRNYRETVYWCDQWRITCLKFVEIITNYDK